jgi:hypothetical protein
MPTDRETSRQQLNFYALPADMAELERVVRNSDETAILHSRSESSEPRVVDSLDLREHGRQWLFFYVVPQADLTHVITKHVTEQGYWTIDDARSPVVQVTRCSSTARSCVVAASGTRTATTARMEFGSRSQRRSATGRRACSSEGARRSPSGRPTTWVLKRSSGSTAAVKSSDRRDGADNAD